MDHDATIIERHKQEATWHYQGGRGYQPATMAWAEQDLTVADEFRDGNVPAGKDNLRLIQRGFCSPEKNTWARNAPGERCCRPAGPLVGEYPG